MILYEPFTLTIIAIFVIFVILSTLKGLISAIAEFIWALVPLAILGGVGYAIYYFYNEQKERKRERDALAQEAAFRLKKEIRDKETLESLNHSAAIENLTGYLGEIRRGIRLLESGVAKSQVVDAIDKALDKIKSDVSISDDYISKKDIQDDVAVIVDMIKDKNIDDGALIKRFDVIFKRVP